MVHINYNSASAGNNPFQFSSGPAGAIASALFNLVTVQTELEKANLEYSMQNTQLSSQMGKAAEDFDIASADAQASATKCQAWTSGVSAVETAVGAGVTYGLTSEDEGQRAKQQENLTKAEQFRSKLYAEPNKPNVSETVSTRADSPEEDEAAANRIEELKLADYKKSKGIGTFTESPALEKYNEANPEKQLSLKKLNERAMGKLSASRGESSDYEDVCKKLDDFINTQTKQVNTLASQIQTRNQYIQQFQQFFTQITQAGGTGAQSMYQAKQGVGQGGAAVAQTTGQLASSMQGTTNSANNTAAQAIGQILGVLSSIARAYSG